MKKYYAYFSDNVSDKVSGRLQLIYNKSLLCYKFSRGKVETPDKMHIQAKIREDGAKLHINKKTNSISIPIFALIRLII
jgi:hypothetical protein